MVLRTLAFTLFLSTQAMAQTHDEDAWLKNRMSIAGKELQASANADYATVALAVAGGLLAGYGVAEDSDLAIAGGSSMILAGVITMHISIGKKKSAGKALQVL